VAESFDYREFQRKVGKFVRANHVQTSKHWRTSEVSQNLLAGTKK
jgi:hypothetical protein